MDGTVERTHNYPMVVCPHCAREVPAAMTDAHASVCIHRPEMKARILSALTSDVPGVGVKMKVYESRRVAVGAAHSTSLLRGYGGTWEAVLEAFGLTVQPSKRHLERTPTQRRMTAQQREAAACADVAAMCEDARRIMAAEYDDAHTFDGYRVRDLPGVTVNGHKCVAVMLR